MPRAPSKTKKSLQVRRHIWRPLDEGSRTEYQAKNGKWIPCNNLESARTYARENGYTGIAITPIA